MTDPTPVSAALVCGECGFINPTTDPEPADGRPMVDCAGCGRICPVQARIEVGRGPCPHEIPRPVLVISAAVSVVLALVVTVITVAAGRALGLPSPWETVLPFTAFGWALANVARDLRRRW